MENDKDIHLKLRNLRISRGLTVNKLAEKMGENHQKVGRVERGTRNITIEYLIKASKALQTPIESIVSEERQVESAEGVDTILREIINFFDEKDKAHHFFSGKVKKADLVLKVYELTLKFPEAYQRQFLDSVFNMFDLCEIEGAHSHFVGRAASPSAPS